MNPIPRLLRVSLVMLVVLLCFSSIAVAETETETQPQTRTATSSYGSQQYLRFSMVPSSVSNTGYPQGNGSADIQAQGTLLAVHFQAEGVASSARLTLILLANSTAHSVVNMTTSYDGEVEAEATVSLAVGSYSVGLQVQDTSSFSAPTTVMVSSPSTESLTLAQASQFTTNTMSSEQTQTATYVPEGETEDGYIRSAIQTRVIPAVVVVGDSGSTTTVNDANFSVSVGRYQQDGYLVSISANNVVGSRVLLVNLTSSQARSLFSGQVQIALDGSAVPQASALSDVLSARSGSAAKFVLISGPSALQVLILIPHFSYHTISILPILVNAGVVLLYYAPALLFSVAAVTAVVLVAYSRRTRVEI